MQHDLTYTCDLCHETCWPDWSTCIEVNRNDEALEIVICDSCLTEIYEQLGMGRRAEVRE